MATRKVLAWAYVRKHDGEIRPALNAINGFVLVCENRPCVNDQWRVTTCLVTYDDGQKKRAPKRARKAGK